MLVQLAIGDSYGAGFEYAPIEFVQQHNTGTKYVQNPVYAALKPGRYTDDTQMSIAVAEAIVSGERWTRELLAKKFVEVYKRDPRPGYAKRFQVLLGHIDTGADLLACINAESDKSGGAMRAIPLGALSSPSEIIDKAKIQASVTHDTPEGTAAAAAAALLAHYCLYVYDDAALAGKFIASHLPGFGDCVWDQPWKEPVGEKGWMSVRAAITAVGRNDNFLSLLKDCIAFTGDTDTVATIALGAAAGHPRYRYNIPPTLRAELEVGQPYGETFLDTLQQRLWAATKRTATFV